MPYMAPIVQVKPVAVVSANELYRFTECLNRPPLICRMLIGIPDLPVSIYLGHLSRGYHERVSAGQDGRATIT
jgi:hypothetical protein